MFFSIGDAVRSGLAWQIAKLRWCVRFGVTKGCGWPERFGYKSPLRRGIIQSLLAFPWRNAVVSKRSTVLIRYPDSRQSRSYGCRSESQQKIFVDYCAVGLCPTWKDSDLRVNSRCFNEERRLITSCNRGASEPGLPNSVCSLSGSAANVLAPPIRAKKVPWAESKIT